MSECGRRARDELLARSTLSSCRLSPQLSRCAQSRVRSAYSFGTSQRRPPHPTPSLGQLVRQPALPSEWQLEEDVYGERWDFGMGVPERAFRTLEHEIESPLG